VLNLKKYYGIERRIALVGDGCSRPPITIRFHDLHVNDIRRLVGEEHPSK
jgi:hypothetical protein